MHVCYKLATEEQFRIGNNNDNKSVSILVLVFLNVTIRHEVSICK